MSISEEVELSFAWGGLKLAGSLHLPPGNGPHPAVVMAQGSGPADRDSDGYFEPIRQTFIDRGIATFAFDKPGCGQSSGNWHDYGLEARAEQLTTALQVVRDHPDIAGERVGLFGHSQGGWLVQMLAGRPRELAFAIAGSAPTISVREQILYDCEQTMRSHGYGEYEVADAGTLARALQQAAVAGVDFQTIHDQLIEPAIDKPWFHHFPTIDGPDDWRHFRLLMGEAHEPLADLERIACPFLAVYGGLDPLLPPWRGAEESGRTLAVMKSPDATIVVFPTGGHRIQVVDTGEFVAGYLNLLGDWAAHRAHEESALFRK